MFCGDRYGDSGGCGGCSCCLRGIGGELVIEGAFEFLGDDRLESLLIVPSVHVTIMVVFVVEVMFVVVGIVVVILFAFYFVPDLSGSYM